MDNFHIDVTARSRQDFDRAIDIALGGGGGEKWPRNRTATHFVITPKYGMVLFGYEPTGYTHMDNVAIQPMPYPMSGDGLKSFVWGWLESAEINERALDHDGSNVRAYRVYNEDWGKVGSIPGTFVAVKPTWGWLGK